MCVPLVFGLLSLFSLSLSPTTASVTSDHLWGIADSQVSRGGVASLLRTTATVGQRCVGTRRGVAGWVRGSVWGEANLHGGNAMRVTHTPPPVFGSWGFPPFEGWCFCLMAVHEGFPLGCPTFLPRWPHDGGQGCIRREGTSEVVSRGGQTGDWRRLPKRLGAVTVGYKCRGSWRLPSGGQWLGIGWAPWRGGWGGYLPPLPMHPRWRDKNLCGSDRPMRRHSCSHLCGHQQ